MIPDQTTEAPASALPTPEKLQEILGSNNKYMKKEDMDTLRNMAIHALDAEQKLRMIEAENNELKARTQQIEQETRLNAENIGNMLIAMLGKFQPLSEQDKTSILNSCSSEEARPFINTINKYGFVQASQSMMAQYDRLAQAQPQQQQQSDAMDMDERLKEYARRYNQPIWVNRKTEKRPIAASSSFAGLGKRRMEPDVASHAPSPAPPSNNNNSEPYGYRIMSPLMRNLYQEASQQDVGTDFSIAKLGNPEVSRRYQQYYLSNPTK